MGIHKSTLHDDIKSEALLAHFNAVKPYLTAKNMGSRVKLRMNHTDTNREMISSMMDVIRFDERRFSVMTNTRKYYLEADEQESHRTTKSKSFQLRSCFGCSRSSQVAQKSKSMVQWKDRSIAFYKK